MKALRCTSCGRALTVPAVTIPTKDEALLYGPRCGRALMVARGIYRTPTKAVRAVSRRVAAVERDPRQLDWVEQGASACLDA